MEGDLHHVFVAFSPADPDHMDNRELMKLCKDCKILTKKVTSADIDITFSKYKAKGGRKIDYNGFKSILQEFAKKEGLDWNTYCAKINEHHGPQYHGTKADQVKWHDDKTTYTGVYAKGGPTNYDVGAGGKINDLSNSCNRGDADVRGVLK